MPSRIPPARGASLSVIVGIPFFGPEVGEVEGVEIVDVCATTSELGIVAALGALLLGGLSTERRRPVLLVVAVVLVSVGHLVHLLLR